VIVIETIGGAADESTGTETTGGTTTTATGEGTTIDTADRGEKKAAETDAIVQTVTTTVAIETVIETATAPQDPNASITPTATSRKRRNPPQSQPPYPAKR
jgi:hypothetical protein